MSNLILFWHRKDLRISDNIGLASAREQSIKVVGVFCLDKNILQSDNIAPVRVAYMIACLRKLQEKYRQLGSDLLILQNDPKYAIALLASQLNATAVFWNLDVESYSKKRDEDVITSLKEKGIKYETFWDQLLHSPEEIKTGLGKPYTVYTPFWKNWIKQKKLSPVKMPLSFTGLTESEQEIAQKNGVINLPSSQDLGFNWSKDFIIEPGEEGAENQLELFAKSGIFEYKEKRDFPAYPGTSLLSPALKFGVIGIRKIWAKTEELLGEKGADFDSIPPTPLTKGGLIPPTPLTKGATRENATTNINIETWQKELAWREFYQQALYWFPELEKGPYRELFKNFPWVNNEKHFLAWCEGKTGYPIVDAAMRQLNETGWMHNRCRMIVASFLTKDLIIDWKWGEKYFMQHLIDGDLASNNGGWQWSASSGMDQQPLRIFNPTTQGQKFDPDGEYIKRWLPELKLVAKEYLISDKIPDYWLKKCGYPGQIVDHNLQQRKFKELYQEQKL